MTARILDLDPGRAGFGWAYHPGYLASAGVVPQPKSLRSYEQPPLEVVAGAVVRALRDAAVDPTLVVVERMQIYPPGPTEKPGRAVAVGNDLLDLQAIGGLVAGWFRVPVLYRFPRQWKGTTDTDVIEARLRVWRGWQPADAQAWESVQALGKTLRHNAVDAVAMVLAEAGRIRWT